MFKVIRLRFHIYRKAEAAVFLGPEALEVKHPDAGPWTSLTDTPDIRLDASAPTLLFEFSPSGHGLV